MKLGNGRKRTVLGDIPQSWNIVKLATLSNGPLQNGMFYEPSKKGIGVRIINVGDLYAETPLAIDSLGLCAASDVELGRFRVEDGDLFFTRSSIVPSGIAQCNVFRSTGPISVVFDSHVIRLRPRKDMVSPLFLFRVCNSFPVRRHFISCAKTATMTTIDQVTLNACPVPLPPTLAEQEAIAEALSDADALIESLEQLLTKKRHIKQGTMQELLTGKKRLPGFSGDWSLKTLREVTDCLDNLRVPLNENQRRKMSGDIPYCGANGVLDFVNDAIVDDDIILIAEDGGYFDEYVFRPIAYRMMGKCWVNNHAHILKAKQGYNQAFVFYTLVHKNILSFLASGTRAKLNKSELFKIEIVAPELECEQTAIATILSDMDEEIATLETKLDKARHVKQGMMQELLTGRIRLV